MGKDNAVNSHSTAAVKSSSLSAARSNKQRTKRYDSREANTATKSKLNNHTKLGLSICCLNQLSWLSPQRHVRSASSRANIDLRARYAASVRGGEWFVAAAAAPSESAWAALIRIFANRHIDPSLLAVESFWLSVILFLQFLSFFFYFLFLQSLFVAAEHFLDVCCSVSFLFG